MKFWIVLFVLLVSGVGAWAQQDHFLYVQTENRQPFYLKLNNRLFSSTESGYVIVPKLGDSSYQLAIGFPKNQFPEQLFTIAMNRKDGGYLLKNFGDRGWGLFNLQSMVIIMNSNPVAEKKSPEITGIRKTDNFSILLANVVNDTAVLYATVREKPAQTATPVVFQKPAEEQLMEKTKKDSPVVKRDEPAKKETASAEIVRDEPKKAEVKKEEPKVVSTEEPKKEQPQTLKLDEPKPPVTKADEPKRQEPKPVTKPAETKATTVSKAAELFTDTSYVAVFIDAGNPANDTVRVSIPFEKTKPLYDTTRRKERALEVTRVAGADTVAAEPAKKEPLYRPNTNKTTTAPSPVYNQEPLYRVDSSKLKKTDSVARPTMVNSDCKAVATDNEIDKLRIRMLAETSDDMKIVAARKLLKQRCFTTRQVKSLSELFHSNEGRYRWFETTYTYVTDYSEFNSLEWLLTEDIYKTRFRSLIRK